MFGTQIKHPFPESIRQELTDYFLSYVSADVLPILHWASFFSLDFLCPKDLPPLGWLLSCAKLANIEHQIPLICFRVVL